MNYKGICIKEWWSSYYNLYSSFINKFVEVRGRYSLLQDMKIFQRPTYEAACGLFKELYWMHKNCKVSESIISVVALLLLKDRRNQVFCVTILTFPYLKYMLVLEQGNKTTFLPAPKIFYTSEMHVFYPHSTYLRNSSLIPPVVNQRLFNGI